MQFGDGLANRLEQIGRAAQVVMNAVRDHFGIGFGGEAVAQAFEIGAQRLVILDDAVVHDRDAVARDVRVGVLRRRHAVGGPPRMRDAHVAADRGRVERILENLYLADGAQAGDPSVLEHRDTGRIVAAVFQAPQTLHENGDRVAFRNHTYDSAHLALLRCRLKRRLVCPTRTGSPARPIER